MRKQTRRSSGTSLLLTFAALLLLGRGAGLAQPHTIGLAVAITCPVSVASGASFQCSFQILNQDTDHGVSNLSVSNTFPNPGGNVSALACLQNGIAVGSLGPKNSGTDTCTGLTNDSAPVNSGTTTTNYQIQLAASGNDADPGQFNGVPTSASATNVIPVLPQGGGGGGGGAHVTGLQVQVSCPASVASGSGFQCTYTVRNSDDQHGVANFSVTTRTPPPGGASIPSSCLQNGVAVASLGPSGTTTDSCGGSYSLTAPINCSTGTQLLLTEVRAAGTDADPGQFNGVPVTASATNSVPVQPQGSGAPGPHATGLAMTLTCPASVGSGDTFQCTYFIQNQDPQHEATNLALVSVFPSPGGASVPATCLRGGSPVATLGWLGSPTDSCSGTVTTTPPINCGASAEFFTGQVQATAIDACLGIAVSGTVTNSVPVQPQACALPTPPGTDVTADFDSVTATFSTVTSGGTTTIDPIDPATAGSLPAGGYAISGLGIAYEISTTAAVSGDVFIGIVVPDSVDQVTFNSLRVLHGEGGALVDRTYFSPDGCTPAPTPPCPAPDFATRTIYARVSSLSPFVLATVPTPSIGPITVPGSPVLILTPLNVQASFTDPGTHTAVWSWEDGTTSDGTVTEANGVGTVTGTHTYTAVGVYRVTLTVTDSAGAAGERISPFIVVYDPNGGFVTGGGWINSPEGAYAADPDLTGRANFGFVSKYPNGANAPPIGETQFQFSVANFKFESTAYEWLVISGAKARYRGVGKVNGAGSYGFELTAWDGQVSGGGNVDRFRIKIWDGNQGNGVVYDNQMGAADGANPTTALGGGSIVIHKK